MQVTDTLATAGVLLGDLSGFQSFCGEAQGLAEELREFQRERVDQWSRETLAAIDHPSEPLGYNILLQYNIHIDHPSEPLGYNIRTPSV